MNRWWLFYAVGALLPFVVKYAYYMLQQESENEFGKRSFAILTLKFLFNDQAATMKTLLTVSGEWLIGAMYVDRLPLPFGDVFEMPQHIALSFFLGVIAEGFLVPPLIGAFVSKFGPQSKAVV